METTPSCLTCGSTALTPNPDGTLTCARCGSTFEVTERVCPDCGAANPPQAERCHACGRSLDLVGFILQTRLQTPAKRLDQVRQRAAFLKQEAETASQGRMHEWWEQEIERRRELIQAQAEQKRQERMLLTGAIIFAAIVLLALVVYTLVTSGSPGSSTITPTPLPF
jgi:predicted amidophosphoribosyltransferase